MAQRLQSMDELFKGRYFEREIIVLCVRWYLRFELSRRDLVEMIAERGLGLGPHEHDAVGAALRARVRQALEPFRATGGPVLARR